MCMPPSAGACLYHWSISPPGGLSFRLCVIETFSFVRGVVRWFFSSRQLLVFCNDLFSTLGSWKAGRLLVYFRKWLAQGHLPVAPVV